MPFLWAVFIAYEAGLVVISLYVFRRGGPDERLGMMMFLVAAAGSQVASLFGARWQHGPEYGVLAFDLALTAALLALVHRSRKFWPLWAAAAQVVGTITHGARWLRPTLATEVYASVQPFWAFPLLAAIVVGAAGAAGAKSKRMTSGTERRD